MAPAGLMIVLALLGAGPDVPSDEGATLDERYGLRTAPILLLARPDVQLDLRLDASQVSEAQAAIARLREEGWRLKGQSGPSVMARRRAIDEEMMHWLVGHLSGDQLERLRQIDLQWEGALAMSRPVVAESLSLTDAQRRTIDRLVAARRELWFRRRCLTPSDREQLSRQALAVLSGGQRELWDRLLGPPCRFAIGGPAGAPRNPTGRGGLAGQAPRRR